MDGFRQDLGFAFRVLRKSPAVSAIAILTLGIAIGATTSIFSVMSALLLKPLPFPAPGQLVSVEDVQPGDRMMRAGNLSWPEFLDLRAQLPDLTGVAAYTGSAISLVGKGDPQRIVARYVTEGFFSTLQAPPIAGRAFSHEEHQANGPKVVMAAPGFWHRALGDAPIGTSINLDGEPHTLIGIANPAAEAITETADVWVPFEERFISQNRGAHFFFALARLKNGISIGQATRDVESASKPIALAAKAEHTATIRPLQTVLRGEAAPILWLMLAAVGTVLLMAAVNLANVLLARASGRVREFAVRRALGASSLRLARQLLLESALLGILGGALGLLLALWGRDLALHAWPQSMPGVKDAPLDGRVMAFAAALSLFTGLAIGVLPAITSSRGDLQTDLREGSGATSAKGRARNALVVAQSALAVLLLVGAALLVQSFRKELQQNPGFSVEHALMLRLQLPNRKYPEIEQRAQFMRQLTERISAQPGVRAVGVSSGLPMGNHVSQGDFSVLGRPQLAEKDLPFAEKRLVTPGYFGAMQIPLLRGRLFTDREPTRVVVINEALAKRTFPNEDPIGKRIDAGMFPTKMETPSPPPGSIVGPSDTDAEIVGVVGDVHQHDLARPPGMEIDFPFDQVAWPYLEVVVRATGEPLVLAQAMKSAVADVDRDLPIAKILTLEEVVDNSVGPQKLSAELLGGFSLAALLLAALGIYGVVSYGVARRTREIGVRMALGAAREDVMGMILREGLKLTLLGVLFGAIAALVATRFIGGFLFGISPSDPLTYLGVALVLALVAALASLLPARRATRVDPASALRSE